MELYIVATPIGNLSDFTFRAKEILEKVDVIACEDTRHTKRLLEHYEILGKKLISYHQHSSARTLEQIVKLLKTGNKIAYVSDAGTPSISDPGAKLVEYVVEKFKNDINIIPIPGVSAITAALMISGFKADNFVFFGFIPHKKGRQKFLQKVKDSVSTVVFYESVHRIKKLFTGISEFMPDRELIVARELTKQFETIYRGKINDIIEQFKEEHEKGEFTIVVRSK